MLRIKTSRSISSLFVYLICFVAFSLFFINSSKPSSSSSTLTFNSGSPPIPVKSVWEEEKRRNLVEEGNNETSVIILAANRTERRDPLDNFEIYNGGYNLSDAHYIASVAFTAVPFFTIGVAWFVVFGVCLFCICLCCCCCPGKPYGYSRICYALSLIFLILFTVAAIVGCVLLYTGQARFHVITTRTLDYVVSQANVTVENLRRVSDELAAAKRVAVETQLLPANVTNDIDKIQKMINSTSSIVSNSTEQNAKQIRHVLDTTRLSLTIIAAVMLFLVFIGFLSSILGLQCLVYILVVFGWILVAGTFVLCGIFLLFHNVVGDTCLAMDEWVLHHTAKTAMDNIIPCVDKATAQQTLQKTKDVTFQLVNVVDNVLSNVSNSDIPPLLGPPLYYNQSGPFVPILCNPYNPDFSERKCAEGEVSLTNATEVWQNYTCQVSPTGICLTPGRLTPSIYDQMSTAVNVSNSLHQYGPFLVDLQDCTFVRQTFTKISDDYCPNLGKFTEWVYVGLVLVSGAVMLSLVFWVIYARERRHRAYTKSANARQWQGYDEAM